MSYYFLAPDENGWSIWARYNDATEEVHVTGLTHEQAEQMLELAGQPIRYDDRQLKLDL